MDEYHLEQKQIFCGMFSLGQTNKYRSDVLNYDQYVHEYLPLLETLLKTFTREIFLKRRFSILVR